MSKELDLKRSSSLKKFYFSKLKTWEKVLINKNKVKCFSTPRKSSKIMSTLPSVVGVNSSNFKIRIKLIILFIILYAGPPPVHIELEHNIPIVFIAGNKSINERNSTLTIKELFRFFLFKIELSPGCQDWKRGKGIVGLLTVIHSALCPSKGFIKKCFFFMQYNLLLPVYELKETVDIILINSLYLGPALSTTVPENIIECYSSFSIQVLIVSSVVHQAC